MFGLFKSKKKTGQSKILVVDDEVDIVSTIQYRLKSCNFTVITANNGKDGLETAIKEKPDIILLDINMPIMSGHEMLERLRNDPTIKDTPVIMLTAYSDTRDVSKAAGLGINDYVTKPFDFAELMDKITNALENTVSAGK
ncbi:MAG: response regulator [Phycisphaerae bacterium]